jgi:hypothetical protein
MYPPLSKSYKGLFPFNIGTTSFIYPDDYVPNEKMLESFAKAKWINNLCRFS